MRQCWTPCSSGSIARLKKMQAPAADGRAPVRNHQGVDGATHFSMKTLPKVSTEMSLHLFAYKLKRVMKMMGVVPMMKAMRA